MPTTKQYAKIGAEEWQTTIFLSDSVEYGKHHASATYDTREQAVSWASAELTKYRDETGVLYFATIHGGRWVDDSFSDGEFGYVKDATFDTEGYPDAYLEIGGDADVEIEWYDA